MATQDVVRYAISVTPIEQLADEQGNNKDHPAGEVGRSLGGSGAALVDDYSQAVAIQGYLNGAVGYLEVEDDVDTDGVSTETGASSVFIKNTGYVFSSATVLGAVSTQSLKVMVGSTVISVLDAGECIFLKDDNSTLDCTGINVRAVSSAGANNSAGHLACEFLVTAAS